MRRDVATIPEIPWSTSRRRTLQREVLAWYRRVARDLPWRRSRDPYAIWISEIMLQQTRVETVKPYYARFLSRFPTVHALAAAGLDEVLESWSGLGYYTRARSLHRAAQAIVAEHGGALPAESAVLARLPGFGPYTTAAVASIAFGLDEAAVDGNIARVLSRWLGWEGDPRTSKGLRILRGVASELLPTGEAGDWNQALMELGATLCAPRRPACLTCPAAKFCVARAEGKQEQIPPPRKQAERPELHWAAALVSDGERVLLAKRPDSGLFASLWELPTVEVGPGEDEGQALARWLGASLVEKEPLAVVAQALTHRQIRVSVFALRNVETLRVAAPYVDWRFADRDGAELGGGMASLTRKALDSIGRAAARRAVGS